MGRRRRRTADPRLLLIGSLLILAWAGIGYRLVYVQGAHAADFEQLGIDQRVRHEELPSPRGTIYDRSGVELAVTVTTKNIVADPSQVRDPSGVAGLIAPLLGLDEAEIAAKLTGSGRYAMVAKRVPLATATSVEALADEIGITGLYFLDEPVRMYPAGPLAAQVVGFVQADDQHGLGGLEYAYDEALAGVPGDQIVERDPYGRPIPQGAFEVRPAVPGADIITTIDREIQYVSEQALAAAVATTGARGGVVIVMDPRSGEILAMANHPTFDPNDRSSIDPAALRNWAVSETYEPGSTLKVAAVAAAIEEGVVSPRTVFDVPQELEIHDTSGKLLKSYADVSRHEARLSVAEIVALSSNVGTIKIQQLLGNRAHYEYLSAFGLGQEASGEFPAESAGLLEPVSGWCETVCGPSTAIGYRVDVTPLQMAALFSTIANDGVWVEPHVVKEIIRADGSREATEPVRRPVLSELTAETMRYLLAGVVAEGTGWRARVPGYTVGGKTGTTEKYLPAAKAYSETDRIASFIGMAPSLDPEIVVAVVLDSPHGETADGEDRRFGGVSAAPLFAEVARAALHKLGVPPDAE